MQGQKSVFRGFAVSGSPKSRSKCTRKGRGVGARPFPATLPLSWDRGEDVVACPLAAAASLGAHPAVLHAVLAVLPALVAANAARLGARPEGCAGRPGLEGRLAGEDPARGVAHVGAVEVEPYAAGQRLGVVLPEAGVGAGCAALGAVEGSR